MSAALPAVVEHVEGVPVLPLRNLVIFPHALHNLYVATPSSIKALQLAMNADKRILVTAKIDPDVKAPSPESLFPFGTLASILQVRKKGSVVKIMLEGKQRCRVLKMVMQEGGQEDDLIAPPGSLQIYEPPFDNSEALSDSSKHQQGKAASDECILANIELIPESPVSMNEVKSPMRGLTEIFHRFYERSKLISPDDYKKVIAIDLPDKLVDAIASHIPMQLLEKQQALETIDVKERILHVTRQIDLAIDDLRVETVVRQRVKSQIDKSQREYYLNEKIKAIQKELDGLEDAPNEIEELEKRIASAGLSEEAAVKATRELKKFKTMSPMSAEASVVRGYLDWLLMIPWKQRSRSCLDIAKAQSILDEDHYGLNEVKDRILEYLAVLKKVKKIRGPALCLVGPPGVGKTSLGESIARAMNIKFVRMALGGVRDEAEIRGHRRTYVGSMPGKIIQKLAKAGVVNPLFLLDEIDKMGMDFRGDPASALLEVLDSEQNNAFNDHYLEVGYDLSQVLFVCTSNSMNIPAPLLDRLEIIRLPGYTEDEKINIAQRYLLPKQLKLNGLSEEDLRIESGVLVELIRYYTKEAGVRGLEREIAKLCRKVVREQAEKARPKMTVLSTKKLENYNGIRKYRHDQVGQEDQIGLVKGLAWTESGGELLDIEAVVIPGKGNHKSTGQLGSVMQESIDTALTYIRAIASALGLPATFYNKCDIHVHVPEGATPKDGPSAGVGMCTTIISALTKIAIRSNVAMTGEINLRGQVMPIGGLKEKLLAAHRGGIKTVIIPEANSAELKEIPDKIKDALDIQKVSELGEILKIALVKVPKKMLDSKEIFDKDASQPEVVNKNTIKSSKETEISTH